jgi:hypothetical protein
MAFAAVKTAQRIPLPSLFACEANCTAKALRWLQRCFRWRPSPGSAKVLGGMRTTSSRHRIGFPDGNESGVDAGLDLSCNRTQLHRQGAAAEPHLPVFLQREQGKTASGGTDTSKKGFFVREKTRMKKAFSFAFRSDSAEKVWKKGAYAARPSSEMYA